MSYNPSQSQANIAWLEGELRRIAEAMARGSDTLRISSTAVSPTKPQEGEIRQADGVNWNPGRGAGMYVFRNGAWQLIEAGFTQDLRSLHCLRQSYRSERFNFVRRLYR